METVIDTHKKHMATNEYGKCLKISNTFFHNILPKFCFLCHCFLKYLVKCKNSVDPDQTVPKGAV